MTDNFRLFVRLKTHRTGRTEVPVRSLTRVNERCDAHLPFRNALVGWKSGELGSAYPRRHGDCRGGTLCSSLFSDRVALFNSA